MFFLAVDPGRTTGIAWWHPASESFAAIQTTDPFHAMQWLEWSVKNVSDYEISVEKYVGGGYKTVDGLYTTELVGWFTNHFRYVHRKDVRTPISQQRLSGMERVQELVASSNVPIPGPHSHDALAHAIVHARSIA